jgi:TetR/AcrR family transcriptional regulator, transcriptional repressor of bet genes
MPKQIDHDQRRDEIARAACHVIAENGFAQTKLVDIATQAGCTTGALRYYFETKDEILNAASDFSRFQSRNRLDMASRSEPYSLVDTLLETLPTNPQQNVFTKVWMEMNVRSLGSASLARDSVDSARSWTRRIVEELEKANMRKQVNRNLDLEVEGELLALGIIGLITRVIIDPESWPKDRQKETLKRMVDRLG